MSAQLRPTTNLATKPTTVYLSPRRPDSGDLGGRSVLLVQPPFFRVVGSHNDRGPLELAYIARELESSGCATTIVNLDATGAGVHCTWRELFERSGFMRAAIEDGTPVLHEAAETILGYEPDAVVLACGDSLTPWVDLGNAHLTAALATIICPHVKIVTGVGPRLNDIAPPSTQGFHATLKHFDPAAAARMVLGLLGRSTSGSADADHLPLIERDVSGSRYDVVMTSIGCVEQCTFCDAADQRYKELPPDTVARDIGGRHADSLDIGDAIFLARPKRVDELLEALERHDTELPRLSAEAHIAHITPRRLDQLQRLGVQELKVGIESGDGAALTAMKKRYDQDDVIERCEAVRAAGLDLTVYVLLGGPVANRVQAAKHTLRLCHELPLTDLVVNVWAYNRPDARPYDCHFSWDLVEEYGLQDIMPEFFDLQPTCKYSIGKLVTVSSSSGANISQRRGRPVRSRAQS